MGDTVKLIIEIPESDYKAICENKEDAIIAHDTCRRIANNGIPLDNDSERAEVQAYFDGEAYGWEEGRKALIDDLKGEMEDLAEQYKEYRYANTYISLCIKIIDKHIGKAEKDFPQPEDIEPTVKGFADTMNRWGDLVEKDDEGADEITVLDTLNHTIENVRIKE